MERIGLFGGTFDPPHLGHLVLAELTADALGLDTVWFVPAANPPHKQGRDITPVMRRLEMLRLALADNPRFYLSRIDVDRQGPHFSVDMVALAQAQRPAAQWYFLMGSDSLRDLPTWHQSKKLVNLCRLAVLQRPGMEPDMASLEAVLPGLEARVEFIDGPGIGITATEIKGRVRAGRTIRYLVPDAVHAYIYEHGLYQVHSHD